MVIMMNSLTPSQFDLAMRKNPFSMMNRVLITRDAMSSAKSLVKESGIIEKELGGVGCYSFNGPDRKTIVIHDIVQKRDFNLQPSSYYWNDRSFETTNRFKCSNDNLVVFHTHPNGDPTPSIQDRFTSVQTNSMGCVIAGRDIRCYVGTGDVDVLSVRSPG
jgi:hypothetical protein